MNVLYSNGDSFVFGMECLGDFNKEENNKEHAFAKHLADQLKCNTYINNAYNGATNEFIFRNTIFDILELEKQGTNPADVFVLVGWTSLYRTEIDGNSWYKKLPGWEHNKFHPRNFEDVQEFRDFKTLFINPSSHAIVDVKSKVYSTKDDVLPFCVEFLWHDILQNPQQEARIIALHCFLKSKGYKHLFVNTCGNYQFDVLDNALPNMYKGLEDTFFDWAKNNHESEHRANNHFGPTAHSEYGKLLFDYAVKYLL